MKKLRISVSLPGIDHTVRKLLDRNKILKSFPQEVTSKDKLILSGPKLWQADNDATEVALAQFERDNKLTVDAIRAKVEDPIRDATK